MQLGTWVPDPVADLGSLSAESDERWWRNQFSVEDDPTGLFCESNVFRYRPLERVVIRVGPGASSTDLARVESGVERCGVAYEISYCADESDEAFAVRLPGLGVERVRVIGSVSDVVRQAAATSHVHLAENPVVANARIELLHYLREQSVSRTLHRFGNLVATDR